jgi:hypothetical protein
MAQALFDHACSTALAAHSSLNWLLDRRLDRRGRFGPERLGELSGIDFMRQILIIFIVAQTPSDKNQAVTDK